MSDLQNQIETRIAGLDPEIELIALESAGPETLRLFIDHPQGVTLELCERVTHQLRDLLAEYALEVSSPGLDRPLTKPQHFERFVGHQVQVQTVEAIDGQRNFRGVLAASDAEALTVEERAGGRTVIPFDRVHRSKLVPELEVSP